MIEIAVRLIRQVNQTNVAGWLSLWLVGLIAVLPLLVPYHTPPLTSFYGEWLALVLGFAGCVAFLSRGFWPSFNAPKAALYLLAMLAIVAIQAAAIPRPYIAQALIPGIYLVWAVLLMVLGAWLKTVLGLERVLTAFAWFLFAGGLLQAFAGLVQYLGIAGWLGALVAYKYTPAVYGNVAQANLFATHLTLGGAALIFLFSREKLSWVLTFTLVTFFAFIVALSASRSVAIYAACLIALSTACYLRNRDKKYFRLLSASTYFFFAFICFQYLLTWINPWLAAQLSDMSLNADAFAYTSALDKLPTASFGLELRISEWHKAWVMFTQSPLLGVGMGNYAWQSFSLQSLPEFNDVLKPQLFGHAHNIFAQLLAETGVLGLTIFVLLLVGWVQQFLRTWPSSHAWLMGSVLLILFIHSNLEFPLWYSFFLGIVAFLIGLGDTRTIRVTFSSNLGRTTAAMALLLIGSTLVTTFNSFREISTFPNPFVEPQEQINSLLAHGGNPILKPYAEIILLAMMPANKDAIADKAVIATRVFHRNPDRYKAYRQVTFLALNGQSRAARELLYKVARAYPNDLLPYIASLKNSPYPEIQELRKYAATIPVPLALAS